MTTGTVIELFPEADVDAAWERYINLVAERDDRNLWRDLEHNQRIVRAWDEWRRLFLATERAK